METLQSTVFTSPVGPLFVAVSAHGLVALEFDARLEPPTTLAEIKQSKKFEDWALVRQGRLSTMSAPEKFVNWLRARYPNARW